MASETCEKGSKVATCSLPTLRIARLWAAFGGGRPTLDVLLSEGQSGCIEGLHRVC